MKRFLKVILIMAVVFGVLGLGLTAGGAAMGATMGDVGILDNGLKRILGIFQDHSVTDDNTWDNDEAMLTAAENAVNEKGVVSDDLDSSGCVKTYEASAVTDLSCNLKYEEIVVKTWSKDTIQVDAPGSDQKHVQISNDNGCLKIESSRRLKSSSIEISLPAKKEFQSVTLKIGAGTVEINGDFKTEQLSVDIGAGTFSNDGSLEVKQTDISVGVGNAEIEELTTEKLNGNCGMGNMDISLTGKDTDYNYELKCGLGNLEVDGEQETALTSGSRMISNPGAEKSVKLECGMGDVNVDFEDE